MKKLNIFKYLGILVLSFLFFVALPSSVKANTYVYENGEVVEKYKKIDVNSFEYDYKVVFDKDIMDEGNRVSTRNFYGGRNIKLTIKEYSHWWPFSKDNDETKIYKYSFEVENFDNLIDSFEDEEGEYIFNSDGLYKVAYIFEDEVIYENYIYICSELHHLSISGDEKYDNVSALSMFSFNLKMKDAYDLKQNKYYYAFSRDVSKAKFREFSPFTDSEKEGNDIFEFDKDISVDIKDSDSSINGEKQYLFVKVVSSYNEIIVQTLKSYELASKLQANVYLVDEEGEIIKDKVSYKRLAIIRFVVMFNDFVTYSNLQYSLNGVEFISINDCSTPTQVLNIEHKVDFYNDFDGEFLLRTKRNTEAVVNNNGANVSLNVVSKADFSIDVTSPIVKIMDDGDIDGRREYNVTISVSEKDLKEVMYYVDRCSSSQGDKCLDKFNDQSEKIINIGASKGSTVKINDKFGKFNGENLALFVKATDNAGNEMVYSKLGFVLDNVIVDDNREIFDSRVLLENDKVIGKALMVKVPVQYKVSSVSYQMIGKNKEACVKIDSLNEVDIFECLKIEKYDFNSTVKAYLVDIFGNVEEYSTEFKVTSIKDGKVVIDNKEFILHGDKDYEIEFKTYNTMNANQVEFTKEILDELKEKLNFNNIPLMENLTVKLVYFDEDKEFVIKNNIGAELQFPSIEELMLSLDDVEKFKACAEEKCDIDVYLKYEYTSNGIPQNRLVKINYIDNSNKYKVENFAYENKVKVGQSFVGFDVSYYDSLNLNINKNNVVNVKKILFEDINGEVKEVEEINTKVLGKYHVRESFEYNAVGSFPLNYIVEVIDDEAPSIRLNGKNEIKLNVGEKFDDPLASVVDNYDSNLTIKTKVEPVLDVKKEGKYIISYWCVDSSGNVSEIVTRTIIVRKVNNLNDYLIAGGIALITILIVVLGAVIEINREKIRK